MVNKMPSKSNSDTSEEFPKLSDDSMKSYVVSGMIIVSSSLTEELRQDALYSDERSRQSHSII